MRCLNVSVELLQAVQGACGCTVICFQLLLDFWVSALVEVAGGQELIYSLILRVSKTRDTCDVFIRRQRALLSGVVF